MSRHLRHTTLERLLVHSPQHFGCCYGSAFVVSYFKLNAYAHLLIWVVRSVSVAFSRNCSSYRHSYCRCCSKGKGSIFSSYKISRNFANCTILVLPFPFTMNKTTAEAAQAIMSSPVPLLLNMIHYKTPSFWKNHRVFFF